jgi:hypothetical protein
MEQMFIEFIECLLCGNPSINSVRMFHKESENSEIPSDLPRSHTDL